MSTMNFGGVEENVTTREEFPLEKAREILKEEKIAIIGYGVQGPAQALNMRDNGVEVIIGQRKGGESWEKAKKDGFIEGETLFEIEEACDKASVVMYLLSDAGQKAKWDDVKKYLTPGKTLCFSHGFSVVYKDQTGIVPPEGIDVVLVAPKGSGTSVRRNFLNGSGINSSYAVFQDASGNAEDKIKAIGIAVGSGFLFNTTFEKEVLSDLTGERGVLMGAIAGLMEAQYNLLRKNGHSPSEAFNETVEEATQSLYPLIGENGMDWMFANCSTTAQRGALDWKDKFRDASAPVFEDLYESVKNGTETKLTLDANSDPQYREKLADELKEIENSEMWQAGKTVRSLRPENN